MLGTMSDGRTSFDPNRQDLQGVRQIVLQRLRQEPHWTHLDRTGDGFAPYVNYLAESDFERLRARRLLLFLAHEVFWQLVVEGVLAPGKDPNDLELPWFHVTEYGRTVLASDEPQPHDPVAYLAAVRKMVLAPILFT
jgi:hypothetical protein